MSKIEVIKVDPLYLPANIVWQISGKQHIALKDFYVYCICRKKKTKCMSINQCLKRILRNLLRL